MTSIFPVLNIFLCISLYVHMTHLDSFHISECFSCDDINVELKVLLFCFAEFFSVDRPRKFELLSLSTFKGSQKACVTTFESNFVGRSTENIRQSKIKAPLKKGAM